MNPPLKETIVVALAQLRRDVAVGLVPPTVTSFAELHDYRDANYYGDAFDWWTDTEGDDSVQDCCDFWNIVQNAIDRFIKEGGLRK